MKRTSPEESDVILNTHKTLCVYHPFHCVWFRSIMAYGLCRLCLWPATAQTIFSHSRFCKHFSERTTKNIVRGCCLWVWVMCACRILRKRLSWKQRGWKREGKICDVMDKFVVCTKYVSFTSKWFRVHCRCTRVRLCGDMRVLVCALCAISLCQ